MKNKLIPALFVLLLTPGLLYAARPSVSNQEQALNILVDALVVCPPNSAVRFVDNGDGTVCDHQTGLMWEIKDASDGTADYDNPDDVDNNYTWTSAADGDYTNPDGTAFTDFLARLNGAIADGAVRGQLGGHNDWRLPTGLELLTILNILYCSNFPVCIDPIFGPTSIATDYWSSTSYASNPNVAWGAFFSDGDGGMFSVDKTSAVRVRAVRGGR